MKNMYNKNKKINIFKLLINSFSMMNILNIHYIEKITFEIRTEQN